MKSLQIVACALVLAGTAGAQATQQPSAATPQTKVATPSTAAKTATPAAAAAKAATPKATYTRNVPATLAKTAKVTEATAVASAEKQVAGSKASSVTLAKDSTKLVWAVAVKVAGKTGSDKVRIDAATGDVLNVVHAAPAPAKKAAPAAATKKPAAPAKKDSTKK